MNIVMAPTHRYLYKLYLCKQYIHVWANYRLLAPHIGLDEKDEEEIVKEKTLGEQKLKMVHVWMQKYRNGATYLQFINGCEQAKRRDLVEAVLELAKEIRRASGSKCPIEILFIYIILFPFRYLQTYKIWLE